jgi:4-hydroxybenzoate polyprenyltransferase
LITFAVMMSLWIGGVGGIAKEFSDVEGDRTAGRRTWPIVLGDARARLLLAVVACLLGGAFLVLAWCYDGRLVGCAATMLAGAVVVAAASTADGAAEGGRERTRRPYRAFMWTQQITHLVLGGTLCLLAIQ